MNDPIRTRFAADHGLTADQVAEIVRLAHLATRANERYCNGDPHPDNPDQTDKSTNAKLWGERVDQISNRLLALVKPLGFTAVEYSGLRPCLKKAHRFIEIPA